jgi:di/tricarboxylate transporter
MMPIDPSFQMWVTLALVVLAIVLFATERIPIEFASVFVLAILLAMFEFFPLPSTDETTMLDAEALLSGFANPALIAVLALLILSEGVTRTGALEQIVRVILRLGRESRRRTLGLGFGVVGGLSAFLNNTPVVVMFIPLFQLLARRLQLRASAVMMPLSFVAILTGMTTLIGTSTNLLVSGALTQLGRDPLGFFDFTVPGVILAAVGLLYLRLAVPRLLPERGSPAERLTAGRRRRFVAQLVVMPEAPFVGQAARSDLLDIRGARLILIQRGEHAIPPPYHDTAIRSGDVLIVMATREAMAEAMARHPTLLHTALVDPEVGVAAKPSNMPTNTSHDQVLVEVMIAPGSRLIGLTLEESAFHARFGCIVLGIERRAHVIRQRLTEVRLRTGDVLVVQGTREDVQKFRATRALMLLDGSEVEIPASRLAPRALAIFLAVVVLAATDLVPIVIAAVCGGALMMAIGVLDVSRAFRAIDRQLIFLIGTSLALGTALDHTGGAIYLAYGLLSVMGSDSPTLILSALFLIVALTTNVLSNNATAVLFTPIAIGIADSLGASSFVFALAVLFGANCSFATPIGYQTNLLVMGPGHYRFEDFLRVGGPLVLLLWLVFSLFVPWYYGL